MVQSVTTVKRAFSRTFATTENSKKKVLYFCLVFSLLIPLYQHAIFSLRFHQDAFHNEMLRHVVTRWVGRLSPDVDVVERYFLP